MNQSINPSPLSRRVEISPLDPAQFPPFGPTSTPPRLPRHLRGNFFSAGRAESRGRTLATTAPTPSPPSTTTTTAATTATTGEDFGAEEPRAGQE